MPTRGDLNPLRFSGPLASDDMIDRDPEAEGLVALAAAGHSFRLVGPRRYGKTTLLGRVLEAAAREDIPTMPVGLQDILALRLEQASAHVRRRQRRRDTQSRPAGGFPSLKRCSVA